MANRDYKLRVFDQDTPDYDMMQQADQEAIEISSPPVWIYKFNLTKSMEGRDSVLDGLYNESDMIDEAKIMEMYRTGFDTDFDAAVINKGEVFDTPIKSYGYYQEPTWQHELSRMGFPDVEEELAIVFNYKKMLADFKGEIKIGDVIKTFRNKIYRVTSAYPADEVIGWKYMHFNVMCIKPAETDFLELPDDPDIAKTSNTGI